MGKLGRFSTESHTFKHNNDKITLTGIKDDYIFQSIKRYDDFYDGEYLDYLRINYGSYIQDKDVLDIGANIGNHTVFFSKICRARNVYAFEPIPEFADLIGTNCMLNNIHNVDIFENAVSYSEMNIFLEPKSRKNLGTYRIVNGNDKENSLKTIAKTITLDGLQSSRKHVLDIGLIKIDVEGLEKDVIAGGLAMILIHHPIIVMESWDLIDTINNGANALIKHGYKLQPFFHKNLNRKLLNLEFKYGVG